MSRADEWIGGGLWWVPNLAVFVDWGWMSRLKGQGPGLVGGHWVLSDRLGGCTVRLSCALRGLVLLRSLACLTVRGGSRQHRSADRYGHKVVAHR
jgi:hypothetical protein